jgi:hypothetical protein
MGDAGDASHVDAADSSLADSQVDAGVDSTTAGPADSGGDTAPPDAADTAAPPTDAPSEAGDAATDGAAADGGDGGDSGPTVFTVGGTITGYNGNSMQLSDGTDTITAASGATTFTFPTPLAPGSVYTVTITAQPTGPSDSCSVTANGTGTVGSSDVTNVQIVCIRRPACAPACPLGNVCGADSDCTSQTCSAGVCALADAGAGDAGDAGGAEAGDAADRGDAGDGGAGD